MRQSVRLVAVLLLAALLIPAAFATGTAEDGGGSADGPYVIEFWDANSQSGILDADHPYSIFAAERFGVTFEAPVIPWNGGTDYLQQLRIRIAAADMPDVFLPWGGIEAELIENDAAYPLGDLIQNTMPVYHTAVSDGIWDFVRSQGNGEIYYLPSVAYTPLGGQIRGDWLDRLGLDMPTTIDEYVEVLTAFRDQDANGNGDPSDEFPTSGREFARWMDHHYAPFGVAMVEGFPAWDIYDGEIQYSAVQQNMKDAIAFVRDLYAEGLLDPETFINTNQIWRGKIQSDQVGVWYHGVHWARGRINPIYDSGVESVNFSYLPVLGGTGYEPFYTKSELRRPETVFNADLDRDAVVGVMQFLEWNNDPAALNERRFDGIEGFHWITVDGQQQLLPGGDWQASAAGSGYRIGVGEGLHSSAATVIENNLFQLGVMQEAGNVRDSYSIPQIVAMVEGYEQDTTRSIAGQFLPPSIYDGYPDIQSHKMYQEYAARIIVGEWELDRFDEFVERWYDEGGAEVTDRAQEFYENL